MSYQAPNPQDSSNKCHIGQRKEVSTSGDQKPFSFQPWKRTFCVLVFFINVQIEQKKHVKPGILSDRACCKPSLWSRGQWVQWLDSNSPESTSCWQHRGTAPSPTAGRLSQRRRRREGWRLRGGQRRKRLIILKLDIKAGYCTLKSQTM